ncbi:MAG TPA: hypothetical protein VNE19_02040 [Methylomirabilota bacterium]|jgi:hypothetical protein|nr:hypothetical protein [Methylomirabilota bacterium]
MIDGLRREFPEALAIARRIPSPRFARVSPIWAVLAAFGAGFFVSAIATIVFSLLFRSATRDAPLPAPFELARLASTAAALAVAWIAGGRSAVVGYVGIVVLERVLGLPSLLRFCGQILDPNFAAAGVCAVSSYIIGLWPQVLGAALAFALVRWLRAGAGNRNPTLEAAGVFVIVQTVGGALLGAGLGPQTAGSSQWPLLLLFLAIAAGIAMGYTILRRATRHWRTLGIIASVLVAEFVIVSLPTFVSQIVLARGTNLIGPFDLLAYFSPIFAMAAAALVLYIAAARKVTATQSA